MPKLWIDDKMYSVEAEVRDYCEKIEERIKKLEAENKKLIKGQKAMLQAGSGGKAVD